MNDNMKRKEDVNRRGRANLEQTKTGKWKFRERLLAEKIPDTHLLPSVVMYSLSLCDSSLYFSLVGPFWQASFLSLLMCLLLVSPRCNYLQNFLIQVKRKIHKYKQQTKSLLNFHSPLLILKKKQKQNKTICNLFFFKNQYATVT